MTNTITANGYFLVTNQDAESIAIDTIIAGSRRGVFENLDVLRQTQQECKHLQECIDNYSVVSVYVSQKLDIKDGKFNYRANAAKAIAITPLQQIILSQKLDQLLPVSSESMQEA